MTEQTTKVAVAMSVYRSDSPEYVSISIESLIAQTFVFFDLYIEVDGPVSEKLESLLISYGLKSNIFVNFNDKNLGLATRLNQIIDKVVGNGSYKYLARMDADDISAPNRFEVQVNCLLNENNISVVGSDVIEISDSGEELFYKKMSPSHDEMLTNIIKKCPFNHPSVMFDLELFSVNGFRYKSELMNTQDYYLWVDLLSHGKLFKNIGEPLLYFRINNDFHSRRGLKKAFNDVKSRVYAFRKLNVLTFSNVIHTLLLFVLRVSPSSIKKLAYKHLR